MTGLDTNNDTIIEIATIITDSELNILAEGPVFAIYTPDIVLNAMDEWNTRQHNQSGLVERIRRSQINLEQAESQTIAFLEKYVEKGRSPMCGNSICQDRRFLARQMPTLEKFFHYRNLDVSTVKELAYRWRPDILESFEKRAVIWHWTISVILSVNYATINNIFLNLLKHKNSQDVGHWLSLCF